MNYSRFKKAINYHPKQGAKGRVKVIVIRINMVPFNQGFTFSFNAIEMLTLVSSRRNN